MSQSHLDYIEEMIAKQMPLNQVLRLLCLYSLVSGGLKSKLYDFFRREIAQTYGYHHLMTLQNLESAGLFRKLDSGTSSSSTAGGVGGAFSSLPATLTAAAAAAAAVGVGGKNAYSSIRRSLRLIVDDVNEHNPNDISYVYSGFAPISVRLVQVAATKSVDSNTISSSTPVSVVGATGQQQQGGGSGGSSSSSNVGWKGWEDALKSLPGPTFEQIQHTDTEALLVSKSKAFIQESLRENVSTFPFN